MKVKFLGTKTKLKYHGFDPKTKSPIHFVKGEIGEVSDERAEKLLADFPEEFEMVKEAKEVSELVYDRDVLKEKLDEAGIKYAKNASINKLIELVATIGDEDNE
jgi:transposase